MLINTKALLDEKSEMLDALNQIQVAYNLMKTGGQSEGNQATKKLFENFRPTRGKLQETKDGTCSYFQAIGRI